MAAPGWYPDPVEPGGEGWLRLWDGQAWTGARRPSPAAEAPTGPVSITSWRGPRAFPAARLLMAGIVAVAMAVAVVAVARRGPSGRSLRSGPAGTAGTLALRPGAPGVAETTTTAPQAPVTTLPAPTSTISVPQWPSMWAPATVPGPSTTVAAPPPSTTTTTVADTTVAPTTTTRPHPRVQVLRQVGTGDTITPTFVVQNTDWKLDWSYSCSGTATGFSAEVRGDGTTFSDRVTRAEGSGSGVSNELPPGSFHLVITSPCAWVVTVTG